VSKYELLNYDELQRRVGIEPGAPWYCGSYPAPEITYDQADLGYNDSMFYTGRGQGHATLCLKEDINVNGLLLNHRDLNGTIWLCTGIDGWWTLPPAEIPDVPKPFWDGSLLTTGRYLTRTITISGCFIPPDPSLVWYNRNALIQVSSIVRGIGLLALCGNETDVINHAETPDDPFLDPPKMAIIQTADVPLIDTTKANGFTQFSLSFRSVYPTKISVYENHESLPIEDTSGEFAVIRERRYRAFGTPDTPITDYGEVRNTFDPDDPGGTRNYSEVEKVNLDSIIKDEQWTDADWEADPPTPEERNEYYKETGTSQSTVLHNSGNYFAFPIFVFDTITGATPELPVIVRNLTTSESMTIQRPVPSGRQLVVDTGMRRVGVVEDASAPPSWEWDDRNYLTLTSEWISLAPGDNTIVVTKPGEVVVPKLPIVYWRDTWIG